MSEAYITDITPENLQEILSHSAKLPVFIHFWNPLNEQSVQANVILEKLAAEMAGQFILAKINGGQQAEMVGHFGVQEIPYYKLAFQGQMVGEAAGLQTEQAYLDLLKQFVQQDPSEQLREQARQAFIAGQFDHAVQLLGEAAKADPNNFKVHLDLVLMYLHTGHLDKAKELFDKLPEEAQTSAEGKNISGIMSFSEILEESEDIQTIQQKLAENPDDPDALYGLAAYLVLNGHPEKAIQTLFKLFIVDRSYKNGVTQKSLLKLFDMLSESNPQLVNDARRKLQGLLY